MGVGQRRGEPESEARSSLPGWAASEQEKKLFPTAPSAWSPARAAPTRVKTAPEAGVRDQGRTLGGTLGRAGGLRALGFRFPSASSLPVAGVVRQPLAPPTGFPTSWWLDALQPPLAGEGVTLGGGRRRRGLPLRPPPPATRARALRRRSCHRPPLARGGGADSRAARQPARDHPARFLGSQGRCQQRPGDQQPGEGPAVAGRRCWGQAGARFPLCAIWRRRLACFCGLTALLLILLLYPPLVGRGPGLPSSPSLPPIC